MLGIFAAGRNGSTLLLRLLDGSPGLWVYPIELNYLGKRDWFARDPAGFGHWVSAQEEALRENYLTRLEHPLAPVEPLERGELLPGDPPEPRLLAFLDSVRRAYAPPELASSALHAFKTVEVSRIDRYRELFPGLRCLHLVRDPLTNYASLKRAVLVHKRVAFWAHDGDFLPAFLERGWVPHARFVLGEAAGDPERHLLVRYEDLVREPERVVRGICDWLGVAPPAEAALQTVLGGRRLRELPRDPQSPDRPARPVEAVPDMPARAGYEEVVSERERALIRLATGDLAERLGYGPASPRPGRVGLAVRWLLPDRWETMNSGSWLALGRALLKRRLYVYGKLLRPAAGGPEAGA